MRTSCPPATTRLAARSHAAVIADDYAAGMPESPPFSPTVALLAVARGWEGALTDALKPLGLTTRTFGLLGHIRGTPGISFSELARRSRITVQSVHSAVVGLVQGGLVDDGTAQAGSASTLRVTSDGQELLTRASVAVDVLDEKLSASHPELVAVLRAEVTKAFTDRS
jgi:DNA-binding MarR family transcriptional regulator